MNLLTEQLGKDNSVFLECSRFVSLYEIKTKEYWLVDFRYHYSCVVCFHDPDDHVKSCYYVCLVVCYYFIRLSLCRKLLFCCDSAEGDAGWVGGKNI